MAKLIFAAAITLLLSALLVDATTTSATATTTAGKVADVECAVATQADDCTVENSDCDATTSPLTCKCKTNYELADEDTTCKLSAGQPCDDDDECASDDCFGSTETAPGLCNGAPVAVTASIVLMFFTFLTSRFF